VVVEHDEGVGLAGRGKCLLQPGEFLRAEPPAAPVAVPGGQQHDAPVRETGLGAVREGRVPADGGEGFGVVVVAGQAQHRRAQAAEPVTEPGVSLRGPVLGDVTGGQHGVRPLASGGERRLDDGGQRGLRHASLHLGLGRGLEVAIRQLEEPHRAGHIRPR
jgi:hypothetical protein